MADCNTCNQYMSTEDILRRSIKCDANGNVAMQGGLLNGNNLTADTTLFKADRTIKLQVVEGIDTTIRDQMILLNSKQTELYLAFNQYV